ncbi:hypothetical protein [Flavihumibacter fluvii]|uniref:hypothetical protein n=1 Tax=Flavihumibacter fluvii TaxID=2838157 RepID=UPI001BDF1960|nr:hypothetical protein [Flavihumibacter fluvii]ULQ51843.1 hypothetical protein KJS93_17280 [Flavihumibacter fluvii]
MKKNDMYYNTHAIKINQDNYRSGLDLSRFFKYVWSVMLSGESPIEHRPLYARKSRRY